MKGGCPFCEYAGPSPVIEYLHECWIFEPLNPVTKGHVLVVPTLHVPNVGKAKLWRADEREAVNGAFSAATFWSQRHRASNIITSSGSAATQTVKHLHVHVVPRHRHDGLMLPWSEPEQPRLALSQREGTS